MPDSGPSPDKGTGVCPGSFFTQEVNRTATGGSSTAITVAANGDLHIVHARTKPAVQLLYSKRSGITWSTEVVTDTKAQPVRPSIALAPSGEIHVVYQMGGIIRHAVKTSKGWEIKDVPGVHAYPTRMTMGPAGALHVISWDSEIKNNPILYTSWTAGAWSPPVIVDSYGTTETRENGIAVDVGGTVHLSYTNTSSQLIYRTLTAGVPGAPVILDQKLKNAGSQLELDPAGGVHVIYNNLLANGLMYVQGAGGVFTKPLQIATLSNFAASNIGSTCDLDITAKGDLWVTFVGKSSGLSVRQRKAGVWKSPQGLKTCCGTYVYAALGTDGTLHISHQNGLYQVLMYSRICP